MKTQTKKREEGYSPTDFQLLGDSLQDGRGHGRATRAAEKDLCLSATTDTRLSVGFKADCS